MALAWMISGFSSRTAAVRTTKSVSAGIFSARWPISMWMPFASRDVTFRLRLESEPQTVMPIPIRTSASEDMETPPIPIRYPLRPGDM